ncbi:MAG: site-specific tyrosine recombinase XerC [Bdellovibrionales bacterium]|nr:site-specific tyrosine recombinase XerC [Bdellovibrionales bacterium]
MSPLVNTRYKHGKRERVPDPHEDLPGSLRWHARRFFEWQAVMNYSEHSIIARRRYLGRFFGWCDEREVIRPEEVSPEMLERYRRFLYRYRNPESGFPMAMQTQAQHLTALRMYFRWLVKKRFLVFSPAETLELPKKEFRLPRNVLNHSEVESILAVPDAKTPLGLRDRAILEVMYSTGIRRSEICGLHLYDLDLERGTVMVRQGKGKRDRMVPIGARAVAWTEKYLNEARAELAREPDEGSLFLHQNGDPLSPHRLSQLVRDAVDASGIGKRGSCHLFRHAMATQLLENGADIRFIQAMLGHAKLTTTEIYTHVSIQKLKDVHSRLHPAAELKPRDR